MLFVIFFILAKLIFMPGIRTECSIDSQCVGELSTCVSGSCVCVPEYFHSAYRCDMDAISVYHVFTVLYILCLVNAIVLLVCIGRKEFEASKKKL